MGSYKILEKVNASVKNCVGKAGYGFFHSTKHGDVYFHTSVLTKNGFCEQDLVVGHLVLIDIVVLASGKQRVGKIHAINFYIGLPAHQNERIVRQAKPSHMKSAFLVGARARGRVKILKEGYGFIEEADHMNLFFALSCVPKKLIPFLIEGVEVQFDVAACERGIMGRVINVIWTELQLRFELVTSNERKNLHIYRRTDPAGKIQYDVRKYAKGEDFCVVAEVSTYPAARRHVAEAMFLHLVVNQTKRPAA
jgi:cold shock CspA family protein